MELINSDIHKLIEFLTQERLNGKTSRMRTRFIKLLSERHQEIEEFRIELLQKHSEKDEKGDPLVNEGSYQLKDREAFNQEYIELMRESFIIDETASKRDMLLTIRRILEETPQEFSGADAFAYDRWCEAFENLKYEEEGSPENN